jgi:hypothetical protein
MIIGKEAPAGVGNISLMEAGNASVVSLEKPAME